MATMNCEPNDIEWSFDDILVEKDLENDTYLQQIVAKFESDLIITPDTELTIGTSEIVLQEWNSSNKNSLKDDDEFCESSDDSLNLKPLIKNSGAKMADTDPCLSSKRVVEDSSDKFLKPVDHKCSEMEINNADISRDSQDTESLRSKHGCSPIRGKNPFKMLKKLTKFDKSRKKSDFRSEFAVVTVDRLPQVFVVKYLGHREVTGVTGLHHVRKPVDDMVTEIRTKMDAKEQVHLPLLYAIVSPKGLDLREHQINKVKGSAPVGVIPINFISYGVQDIKYWRVFTCIIVRSRALQSKSATCHAFLCDTSHNGRKMALSLGAAFSVYSKKLQTVDRSHSFKVELRPPDELVDEIQECDA